VAISQARKKRTALFLSIIGLMLMVAAISAISARDPDGVALRIGMILLTLGAAMWLPWQALMPAALAIWLGPNIGRNVLQDYPLFSTNMILEAPGILGLAAFSSLARISLRELEEEHVLTRLRSEVAMGLDPETGVYDESHLRISIEAELSRARRFGRTFALVLVGIDEMRQRFDYRDEATWQASFVATAELLRGTRHNVDRVFRYGTHGFAMVLPESGPKDVNGMVRRLRRLARKWRPAEGEPGGPLPAYFGATFFPICATSTEDLLRRAGVALRVAEKNVSRVQLDGAEAPEMPPVETFREIEETDYEELELEEAMQEEAAPEPAPTRLFAISGPPPHAAPPDDRPATASAETTEENEPAFAPTPLFAGRPDAIEVDEEPPFEVYALQAPEPAVDEYADGWQYEAPLSVLPRPQITRKLTLVEDSGPGEPIAGVDDALKRLDETLSLIRSLKQRGA
jgi:diguanylate cyclase (GGDEF)-like protein